MDHLRPATGRHLQLDRVLSTQPELGPHIPDGGYGWIILLATSFFQLLIPSTIVAYGTFMMFLRLEISGPIYPTLWDNPLIYAPLFFVAAWTFIDPWSRTLISNSIWPRLVGTAGTCLMCAGLLFIWFAITNGSRGAPWFVISGILSGVGASLVIAQCEVIVAQYFHLKFNHVNVCIQLVVTIGFIATPIFLGKYIIKDSLPTVIIWYQIIILQGMAVCLLIKKPAYLKGTGKTYRLVQGMNDDEIDIFAKSTDLQTIRQSSTNGESPSKNEESSTDTQQTNNTDLNRTSTKSDDLMHEPTANKPTVQTEENLIDIEIHPTELDRPGWVEFDKGESTSVNSNVQKTLRKSFSADLHDLDRIETFEDNFVPKPLFTATRINNNNSYSFGTGEPTSEEPVVFMPAKKAQTRLFEKEIVFMKQPTFYKSLLQIITTKFSIFTFFALFPSYVYMRVDDLRIHTACNLIGCISITSLFFVALFSMVGPDTHRRAFFLWIFSWTGAFGYIILSDVKSESWLVIGAIQVVVSIQSLQYFGGPLLKLNLRGETSRTHSILSCISGLSFFIFFGIDFSYVNCFRMMALLQFLMGAIWFSNFLFKKIKPMFPNNS